MKLSSYLDYFSLGLLSLFLFLFPLLFTTFTTDAFVLPKQILLIGVSLLVFLLLGLKSIADKRVTIRRSPYDLPLLLFLGVNLLGSILSVNKAESLTAFVSLFFAVSLYFLFTNTVKSAKALTIVILAFLEGALLSSVWFALNFFKLYLPIQAAKSQLFTPLGSLLDLAVYVSAALALLFYLFFYWRSQEKIKLNKLPGKSLAILAVFGLKALVLLGVLGLSIYSIVKLQRPVILPFETGFQVAFASISQDLQRWILSFLFGSGFGTFASDFAKFKLAAFNQSQYWNLTFFRSSSFVLELLATTGVLGLLSYLYLFYKVLKSSALPAGRQVFIPLLYLVALSFVLPMSSTIVVLLFAVLGIYGSLKALSDKNLPAGRQDFFDVQLALVTLQSGLVQVSQNDKRETRHGLSKLLPTLVFLLILAVAGFLGTLSAKYIFANKIFQESLIAANSNKGSEAYTKQSQALNLASYNDAYQRVFSQTNLALANSLSSQTPKGASPSAQTQQTIYTLIQQSINSARLATSLSPNTSLNWQNLSGVYRSLIGFGKNADQFAILAQQQAIALDPTNPQEYLNLGGLYFQLNLWDKAAEQFRAAINLKPDFANGYYNLSHALSQKGDLKGALEQMEIVKDLVKSDKTNSRKVEAEIDALKNGLATGTTGQNGTQLPPQYPPVPIPPPATPKPSTTPTPAPQQPLGATPTLTPVK